MPTNPLTGAPPQYGPFTSAITGPLTPQQQQPLGGNGWPGRGGAIVSFVDNFVNGLQQGRRSAFERSEQQKLDSYNLFNSLYQQALNSPTLNQEGKAAAYELWSRASAQTINHVADQSERANKDHPLWHFSKAVAGALAGPGNDPSHIDYNAPWIDVKGNKNGVNPIVDMAAIIHAPQYQFDPSKIGLPVQFAEAVQGGQPQQQTQPQQQSVVVQPQQQQTAPQPPNILTQGLDQYQPQAQPAQVQPQQSVVVQQPQPGQPAQAAPPNILTQGLDKYPQQQAQPATAGAQQAQQPTTPPLPPAPSTRAEFLNTPQVQAEILAARKAGVDWTTTPLYAQYSAYPATAVAKAVGAPHLVKDANSTTGYSWLQNYSDGSQKNTPGAPEPSSLNVTPKEDWVLTPGSDVPIRGFVDPKKKNGYVDVYGKALPEGTIPVAAPVVGSGIAAENRQEALASLHAEGIENPTPTQINLRAGQIGLAKTNVSVGGQQQNQAIKAVTSGVGPGAGVSTPPISTAPATSKPISTTPPVTGPVASPSPVPKKSTLAAAGVPNRNQQDNIQAFLASDGNKNLTSPRVIQGRQALESMTGLGPVELDAAVTDYRGQKKALENSITYAAGFDRVEQQLEKEGQVLLDAVKNAKLGGVPLANKSALWIRQNAGAHPELQRYVLALNAVKTAYATMLSNAANSNARLSVNAAEAGNKAVKDESTMADIVAAVDQMRIEAKAKHDSLTAQQDDIKQRLRDNPIGKALQPKTAPMPTQKASGEVPPAGIADKMVDGQEVVSPTGARWVKRNGKLEKK